MSGARLLLLVGLISALAGCRSITFHQLPSLPANAIRPIVAVTEFENESGFSGQWKLGRGIPDLLVAELLATDRLIVVDRKNLGDVFSEITRQDHSLFRKEDGVTKGRLKNARYLIRGVITDFTQTGSSSAWFRSQRVAGGISGARALVMISMTLTDVETGEVLCSVLADGTAKASKKWASFEYNSVTFGGELFFKTPIGRATQEATRKAVYQIVKNIPYSTWTPRVAEMTENVVIINGGQNVGVRAGDQFQVREAGHPITDPDTGNIIDVIPGKKLGLVRVTSVRATASEGELLNGQAWRGCYLEKLQQKQNLLQKPRTATETQ